MKETIKLPTIPVSELVLDGVYFNTANNLIRVDKIDTEKKTLNLFNISEQTHLYFIKFDRHTLAKRVR
jgi:hypothetical protein